LRKTQHPVWLLAAVISVAALLFFHPHEFVFGGADAGVYVNLGASISSSGGWRIEDPDVAALDPALYPALFREHPSYFIPRYIQLPGFYLEEPSKGVITPQFYPLHPVWMAILYSLGGLETGLGATPLWGVLGCVALYFAAQAVFAKRTGLLAMAFLVLSATQIWFSRYPTSEVLTQFLLFGGIYAFVLYLQDTSPWHALLAGLALGEATLARIDLYFLLAIPVSYAIYWWFKRALNRRRLFFFIPFFMQVGYSLLFARLRAWPYFYNVYSSGLRGLTHAWPLLILGAGIGGVGLLLLGRWVRSNSDGEQRAVLLWSRAMQGLAVFVVLVALYAYFVRPQLADSTRSFNYWYGGHEVPSVEPYNLPRLGWYISPLGIALAVAGTLRALWSTTDPRSALLLGMGLFFSFFFIQNSRNNPHHIYVMRRYVPVVIPFFMVMAAYFLTYLWTKLAQARWLAAVLGIVLVLWLAYNSRYVIPVIQYRGAIRELDEFAAVLGEESTVILFNDDRSISTGATIGTPLHYLYGYTVFDMQESEIEVERLADQVRLWQGAGRRVLLASGSAPVEGLFAEWPCVLYDARLDMELPLLEISYEHFPQEIVYHRLKLDVCEVKALP
jgi:4-amino-4-deoxy-L-arabinose transferase-like glycosyltransferase